MEHNCLLTCPVIGVDTGESYMAHDGQQICYDEAGWIHICEGRLISTIRLPTVLKQSECNIDDNVDEINISFQHNVSLDVPNSERQQKYEIRDNNSDHGTESLESNGERNIRGCEKEIEKATKNNQKVVLGESKDGKNDIRGCDTSAHLAHSQFQSSSGTSTDGTSESNFSQVFLTSVCTKVSMIRASVDGKYLALKGLGSEIEIRSIETGAVLTPRVEDFAECLQLPDELTVHGFFWITDFRLPGKTSSPIKTEGDEKVCTARQNEPILSQSLFQQTKEFFSSKTQSLSSMAFRSSDSSCTSDESTSEPKTPTQNYHEKIYEKMNRSMSADIFEEDDSGRQYSCQERISGGGKTDPGANALVVVTLTSLLIFSVEGNILKLQASKMVGRAHWFVWSHETRILILGTGSNGCKLSCYQFRGHRRIVKLPSLDLNPPWGSPAKENSRKQNAFLNMGHKLESSIQEPLLRVSRSCIWIIVISSRVYLVFWDKQEGEYGILKLYRLYEDHVAMSVEIPLCKEMQGSHLSVFVVDNTLLVYSHTQGLVQVIDIERAGAVGMDMTKGIMGYGSLLAVAPLCPPTRIALLHETAIDNWMIEKGHVCELHNMRGTNASIEKCDQTVGLGHFPMHNQVSWKIKRDEEKEYLNPSMSSHIFDICEQKFCILCYPDWLIDTRNGTIWKLTLNLYAISNTCTEARSALSFIQRRTHSFIYWQDPQWVCLQFLRKLVNTRAPFTKLRRALEIVIGNKAPKIAPEEFALTILAPLLIGLRNRSSETKSEISEIDSSSKENLKMLYLQGALIEMLAVCVSQHILVGPDGIMLLINAYRQRGQQYLLPGLLRYCAPLVDCTDFQRALLSNDVNRDLESIIDCLRKQE